MSTPYQTLLFERDDAVAYVTLRRPERLNAFNMAMRDDLFAVCSTVRDDPSIAVLVLRGEGRGFCSGGDIGEFGQAPSPVVAREVRWQRDVWGALRSLTAITIASVHGHTAGSGMEMALLCDFRIAAADTVFSLPETALGVIPGVVGTQTVPRVIGEGRALAMILAGTPMDAREALRVGLVGLVVPVLKHRRETIRLARQLAAIDRDLRCALKDLVTHGVELPMEAALVRESIIAERIQAQLRMKRRTIR